MTSGGARATRTMVVWCPDWPVVAAQRTLGLSPDAPVAVLRANRVIAASASARADGVKRVMRRREAQSRCPEVEIVEDDPDRDARAFELVAQAIDQFTPRIEIVRPGFCQFSTRGPSRYFGGDESFSAMVVASIQERGISARIGIADGPFAAALSARLPIDSTSESPARIVPAGESSAFLAPYSLRALVAVQAGRALTKAARGGSRSGSRSGAPAGTRAAATTQTGVASRTSSRGPSNDAEGMAVIELVDLLQRLGIRTLGDFAALPKTDVLARFGLLGERMWRIAAGLDERAPNTRQPPVDLLVEAELDPPLERIDTAAFIARGLAEELYDRLSSNGMACTRISIEAETEGGDHLARLWRHERAGAAGGLTPVGLADRVRWQLDGWLQTRTTTSGGIVRLRLVPDEVVPDEGRQLGLWGGASAADERAARAFARIQGLLGPDAVSTPVLSGGRRPAELITHIPWGDQRRPPDTAGQPWPGQLPAPLPTVVHAMAVPTSLIAADGEPVRVSGRGDASSPPERMLISQGRGRWERIVGWAGPWPLEERWWDLQAHRRQARMQILTESGDAHLVVLEGGDWWIEASYQ